MRRYTDKEKMVMKEMYDAGFTCDIIAKCFKCAWSTVYYATHPKAYEKHKEHVYYVRNKIS